LRKFLDDAAWLENRRIMDILRSIEIKAIEVRDNPPSQEIMTLEGVAAEIELPLERPLYTPKTKIKIKHSVLADFDEDDIDTGDLFSRIFVDSAELARHIRQSLREHSQVTLCELVAKRPVEQGLAELLTYLQLATGGTFDAVISEHETDTVEWQQESGAIKQATLPRIIFVR
jgi:hypothetical protein